METSGWLFLMVVVYSTSTLPPRNSCRLLSFQLNRHERLKKIKRKITKLLQVTAAAFGGANLDVLYVTTAQLVVNGIKQPDPAGAVFKVTGTGAKGLPGYNVKLEP